MNEVLLVIGMLWSIIGLFVFGNLIEDGHAGDSIVQSIIISLACGPLTTFVNIVIMLAYVTIAGYSKFIEPPVRFIFGGFWRWIGTIGKYD
jgi:hypothetical protein